MSSPPVARAEGIEIVTSIDAFDALASEWPESDARQFGPLTSHEWFSCAARAFCAPNSLHAIVYRRGGRIAAIAPLFRSTRHGLEWLELIGASALFEPGALPAVDQNALAAVCAAVLRQDRPVFLQRLDVGDPCIRLLESGAGSNGKLRRLSKPGTYLLSRGATWAEVSAGMPARRRKRLTRLRDELNAHGPVAVDVLAPGPEELPGLFATVMKVEAAGWKGRGGSALLVNARVRRFFEDLSRRFATRGELRVFLLRLNGTAIAVQLGIEQGGRYWALKRGFDEAWRQYSPGILLTSAAVAHMLDQRRAGYEFLGSPEDWQRQWEPQERALCALAYYPQSLRGSTAYAADALIGGLRTALRRARRTHGG
jgi:CelD/BcsL family acetyltransferase involved in cellulose biosynthesis